MELRLWPSSCLCLFEQQLLRQTVVAVGHVPAAWVRAAKNAVQSPTEVPLLAAPVLRAVLVRSAQRVLPVLPVAYAAAKRDLCAHHGPVQCR